MNSNAQRVRMIERSLDRLTFALANLINAGDVVLDDFAKHIRPRIDALLTTQKPRNGGGTS